MNINPSDLEVRQGYSPVEEAAALLQAPAASPKPLADKTTRAAELDPKSQAAITAADRQVARDTAAKISSQIEGSGTSLKIRLLDNAESGVQVEILDKASQKVLRKIPQDELIKLSASIKKMTGLFLNQST